MLISLLGKTLAAKIAVGVAGLSMTGVAVAAETGSLPAPVQQAAYGVAGDLGVPAPDETSEPAPTDPVASPTDPVASPTDPASAEPSESPEPGVTESEPPAGEGPDATGPAAKGLCHAYRAGADTHNTAQRALATAAGGAEHVGEYCDQVLAAPSDEADSASDDERESASDESTHLGKQPTTKPGKSKSASGSGKSSGKGSDGNKSTGSGADHGKGGK